MCGGRRDEWAWVGKSAAYPTQAKRVYKCEVVSFGNLEMGF